MALRYITRRLLPGAFNKPINLIRKTLGTLNSKTIEHDGVTHERGGLLMMGAEGNHKCFTVKFAVKESGFHIQVQGGEGIVLINPYDYKSFFPFFNHGTEEV